MLSTVEDQLGNVTGSLRILGGYHHRMSEFLERLIQVAERSDGGDLSPAQREELGAALRRFQAEAARYQREEETTFFPRLRQMNRPDSRAVNAKLHALEDDHWLAHFEHDTLDRIGRHWLEARRLTRAEFAVFCGALGELNRLYRHHFRVEEEELFPLAGDRQAQA